MDGRRSQRIWRGRSWEVMVVVVVMMMVVMITKKGPFDDGFDRTSR